MDDAQILDKINSFDQWHYQFDLAGHKTPVFWADVINRHEQRKDYYFRPLVDLCGGSLAGKRVLDLGCNAGFWSLRSVESGCDYVLGIDGRQMHIDQAEFVFDVKGVDKARYDFWCGNVFDLLTKDPGKFDIVLFLGLMYHIGKPMTLLERISEINADLLVIDTALSPREGSVFETRRESLEDPRHAVDNELVLVPTKGAVLDLVQQFGYQAVTLKPTFTDYTGAQSYRKGIRRAFICAKQSDLTALDAEVDLAAIGPRRIELMRVPSAELARALVAKAMRRLRRYASSVLRASRGTGTRQNQRSASGSASDLNE